MKSLRDSSQPQTSRKIYQDRNLQIIFGVILMAVLGATSITPAFPRLVRALNISLEQVGLLTTVFVFPVVVGTPISGILADRVGKKKILFPSLMLFAIAGAACAFAQDFKTLLEFRFLQGVGAASLESLGLTLISDLYSGKELTAAMGYNASVIGISLATYPLIGGALALGGWRYPFLLPIAAIPIAFLVLLSLKNRESKNEQELKEYLRNVGRSVNNRQVIGLLVATIALFILLFGAFFTYIPVLAGNSLGADDLTVGVILATMALAIAVSSVQLEKLTKWFKELALIKLSFILYAVSLAVVPFIRNVWALLIPAIVFGYAHGLVFPCSQALLGGLAPKDYRAGFMSINATILALGQTLGPLLAGAAFGIWGMNGVFYSGASFAIITLILLHYLLLPRQI